MDPLPPKPPAKSKLDKILAIGAVAAVILFVAGLILTSRRALWWEGAFLDHHRNPLANDLWLEIAKWRYADEPRFQRAIALEDYRRAEELENESWEYMNRVIDSPANGELRISPLLLRKGLSIRTAIFCADREDFEGAQESLTKAMADAKEARRLIQEREAKGDRSWDENTSRANRSIEALKQRITRLNITANKARIGAED